MKKFCLKCKEQIFNFENEDENEPPFNDLCEDCEDNLSSTDLEDQLEELLKS